METLRHKRTLKLGGYKLVVAPRYFVINNENFYVHIIDGYCTKVLVYAQLGSKLSDVFVWNAYKTYSNTKGLYFNFRYREKYYRIYIGE